MNRTNTRLLVVDDSAHQIRRIKAALGLEHRVYVLGEDDETAGPPDLVVVSVVARDMDARQMQTGEVMTTDVVTATEDDTVIDVLEQMRRRGVRRIPVIGAQGVLIGLVTLDSLTPGWIFGA